MCACVLVAAAAVLHAAPTADASSRIAVIVLGDAVEAGRIQADVERELLALGARLKSAPELAQSLAVPAEAVPQAQPVLLEAVRTKISEAEAAFLRGEFTASAAAATEARSRLALVPIESAPEEHVLAHLWHAASLQTSDLKGARAVMQSLFYDVDPKLSVNPDVFPPDFVAFAEAERKSVKTVPVRLVDLPATAQAWVNGRKVDPKSFEVVVHPTPNKQNIVTVRAPGYRTAVLTLPPIPPDTPKSLPLAPDLSDADLRAVRAALGEPRDEQTNRALADLGQRSSVSSFLLLQARGKTVITAVLWKDKKIQSLAARTPSRLAGEAMQSREKPDGSGVAIVTAGAVEVSLWQRELGGGDVYSLPLTGTGPRLSADLLWNSILASADFSYIQYLTSIEASVTGGGGDDGSTLPTRGGTALRGSAGVGLNRAFGAFSTGALVGARFEQYSTSVLEVEDASGEAFPIVGSHTWAGPQAQLRAGYTIGSIGVSAGAGEVFASTYTEAEKNMSGRSPAAAAAPFWRVGGTWNASPELSVGAQYAGESRSTKFKGAPALQQAQPRQDLVLTDFLTTFAVTAAYSF